MKDTRARQIKQLENVLESNDIDAVRRNKIRLETIPAGKEILGDRGFASCAPSYPNLNSQIVPYFLDGRT